jgi:hypothetical protein
MRTLRDCSATQSLGRMPTKRLLRMVLRTWYTTEQINVGQPLSIL